MNHLNCPIILASSSPRRVELMRTARISVLTRSPDVDESVKKGESPKQMVARLARDKAEAVMESALREHSAAIIIAADTTVVGPDGKSILGKPADAADAFRILKKILGKTHQVHTGYCILSAAREMKTQRIQRVITSKVTMRKLSDEAIRKYLALGESMDKAGAYAAQGHGALLIQKVSGSHTNVIGLPMAELLEDLEKKFGVTAFA
jgi:septum formation protein